MDGRQIPETGPFGDIDAVLRQVGLLKDPLVLALQLELARQWLRNHADTCGEDAIPYPHAGPCYWPLPAVLQATMSQSEVYLLLLAASGASVGFQ